MQIEVRLAHDSQIEVGMVDWLVHRGSSHLIEFCIGGRRVVVMLALVVLESVVAGLIAGAPQTLLVVKTGGAVNPHVGVGILTGTTRSESDADVLVIAIDNIRDAILILSFGPQIGHHFLVDVRRGRETNSLYLRVVVAA